ncbi:MAG: GNAT family N-acetyltransferase [Nanoarchaeota archaeon]|nr:GNAT family N-acetyltransferase [Nanoarchaeota archaeon]
MTQLYTPTQGIEVIKYESFAQIDQTRLKATINSSFQSQGKELLPNYFGTTQPLGIYVVGDYIAGAITKDLEDTTVYLCKFFVHPEFEGKGIGKILLKHVLGDLGIEPNNNHGTAIILRTDPKNKKSNILYLNEFFNHFGGSYNVESSNGEHKWAVHQIGLEGEDLERKVKFVADLPITMVPVNGSQTITKAPELPQ